MTSPVPGYKITTGYGIAGKHWKACGTHTGVDYAAPKGANVVAAIAGTIRHRQYGSAYGPYQFAISPSAGQPFANDEVFYAHVLDRLPDGTEVQVGQTISHVGSLGNATGPHLHFEYHAGKNNWSCGSMRNPAPVIAHSSTPPAPTPTPPPTTPSGGPYVTANIYSNKLGMGEPTNGDAESDTVKELRLLLDKIKLVGGQTLGASPGVYNLDVDEEVRLWQEQVVHDTPDAPGKSYLGPKQRAAMFPSPPYTIHDTGLPAVATGGGGGGGSDGGSTPPPTTGGDGSTRPVAPSLILPGALWDPIPKAGGGWFTGLRPFTGTAKKITLHTTESANKPNWAKQQSGIPHLTVDLVAGGKWQHLPFDIAAYTMSGGEHSPNSDSGLNIQIEMIGFANDSPRWTAAEYTELKRMLIWLSQNLNIPYVFPVPFDRPAMRLDWENEWKVLSGILGHEHAPYNDHWDPGNLDTDQLENVSAPVPPGEKYVTQEEWHKYREAVADEAQDVVDVVDPNAAGEVQDVVDVIDPDQ